MNCFEKISQVLSNSYLIGFASFRDLLNQPYAKFCYAISLVRRLDDSIIDEISTGPTRSYLSHYHQINQELSTILNKISDILTNDKITHFTIKPTLSDDELDDAYLKTLRTSFPHKMAATTAGLGWIGKTDLLVTKKYGPRVRLATILLDKKITDPGKPVEKSRCGKCDLCVQACPAKAATGTLWDKNTDRDEFYDAFACRKKCKELSRVNLKENVSICGICISVCPIGSARKNNLCKAN